MAEEEKKFELDDAAAGRLRDVYDWLSDAPKLRDSFVAALAGPDAAFYDEDAKKELLRHYTRNDFLIAYERGFC